MRPTPAQLTASVYNRLDQYANSPVDRAYSHAELAVSSLVVTEIIANARCACPRRDGQAELAWLADLNTKIPRKLTHFSRPTNRHLSGTA